MMYSEEDRKKVITKCLTENEQGVSVVASASAKLMALAIALYEEGALDINNTLVLNPSIEDKTISYKVQLLVKVEPTNEETTSKQSN